MGPWRLRSKTSYYSLQEQTSWNNGLLERKEGTRRRRGPTSSTADGNTRVRRETHRAEDTSLQRRDHGRESSEGHERRLQRTLTRTKVGNQEEAARRSRRELRRPRIESARRCAEARSHEREHQGGKIGTDGKKGHFEPDSPSKTLASIF